MALDPDTTRSVEFAALAAVLGAAFGVFKFFNGGESLGNFRKGQFAKTVALWAFAGATTSLGNKPVTQAGIGVAASQLAPLVNAAWDAYLPPSWGGSATHGAGASQLSAAEELAGELAPMLLSNLGPALSTAGGGPAGPTASGLASPGEKLAASASTPLDGPNTPAASDTSEATPADDTIDATTTERVEVAVNAVPDTRAGWLKLRAVAGQIPAINGNGTRDALRQKLRKYADQQTVLDAFATVEARERGAGRGRGDESP